MRRTLQPIAARYLKRSRVDEVGITRPEQELARWVTELLARKDRLPDTLENGKIEADMLQDSHYRLDHERAQLAQRRRG